MNITSKHLGILLSVFLAAAAGAFGCELLVTFPSSEISDGGPDSFFPEGGDGSSLSDAAADAANDAPLDSTADADASNDVMTEDVADAPPDAAPDTSGDAPVDSPSDGSSDAPG